MIGLNVVVLLVAFYEEPSYWTYFQWMCAFIFNCIFFCEFVLKAIGYGWTTYYANGWNRFDFFLVARHSLTLRWTLDCCQVPGPSLGCCGCSGFSELRV